MESNSQSARVSKLASVLRTFGALILLGSALTFLIQRWDAASHLLRYFYFLGFTAVLALGGCFCGVRLKESKGARTFLGLVTLITTIHFCQLGSFVFSVLGDPEFQRSSVPAFLDWRAPRSIDALLAVGVGLTVLAPMVYTGFSALLRPLAAPLTLLYLLENAALLVPTRESPFIAVVAVVLAVVVALVDRRVIKRESAAATQEGLFVRVVLAMPIFMLIARNVALYPVAIDSLLVSSALTCFSIFSFVVVPSYLGNSGARAFFQVVTFPFAALAWLFFCYGVLGALPASALGVAMYALPMAAIFVLMSVCCEPGAAVLYRSAVVSIALGSGIAGLSFYGGIFATLECVVLGLVTAAYGFDVKSRGLFVLGSGTLAVSLLYHIDYAMELYSMSPWLTLGVVGVLVVVGASVLERYHHRIFAQVRRFKGHFASEEKASGLFEVAAPQVDAQVQ